MRKNPLKQSKFIGESFSKYAKSTFTLKNEKYNNDFQTELDNLVLTKGPFLKVELPFKKVFSLSELIKSKEVSPLFKKLNNINLEQTLYHHQYESLKRLQAGANVVITTGTGSGKTEAFLYPILDNLMKRIENGGKLNGIQAILLYPMNALVNDQLRRLRKLLSNFPEITFGYFTGDTAEDYNRVYGHNYRYSSREEYISIKYKDEEFPPPPNEKLVRQEIYDNPPNILITNYSMLEYLLVRPRFSEIINEKTLKEWSFMVLDEAHTYRGITATEVSHLLKRLQYYAAKPPQFILTSATLGTSEEDKGAIIKFAEKLTSVSYTEDDIIYSLRIDVDSYEVKHSININDYKNISDKVLNNEPIDDLLKSYNAANLSDLLSHDKNVHLLYRILKTTMTFDGALVLMKVNEPRFDAKTLVNLINLITTKRTDGYQIYDIKYHFFLRTLEGAFISLKPDPKLKITNRQRIDDLWAFEVGSCRFCNSMYILGKEYEDVLYRTELDLEENYADFEDSIVNFYVLKDEIDSTYDGEMANDFEECTVCSKCGFIYQNNVVDHKSCNCGELYKVELLKVKTTNEHRNNLVLCPVCGKRSNKTGVINSFRLGKDESTALIAQILLESMTDEKEKIEVEVKKDILAPVKKVVKKRRIKQFLAFSDSRQQASFFAYFFQIKQDDFLRISLVVNALDSAKSVDVLVANIEEVISDNNLLADDSDLVLTPAKNAYVAVLTELLKVNTKHSLEGLGLLNFEPDIDRLMAYIPKESFKNVFPKIKWSDFKTLVCIFVDFFRTIPAVNYTNSGLTRDEREKYLVYRSFDNYVMQSVPAGSGRKNIKSLIPLREKVSNSLFKYMMKTFNLTFEETANYCKVIWDVLADDKFKIITVKDSMAQLNFSSLKVYPRYEKTWYQCDKCKTLTVHNINNACIVGDCSGQLKTIDPDIVLADNYYRNEYLKNRIEKMVIKEHTGQLGRSTGSSYQKDFKDKKINILSSSTTFEMGIDIGDLDTVFMRNIPPTNANYAQRAGRAGRSDESVALIVTYANHNSHDQIYFNDPIPMIEGSIKPPHFNLENHKITFRHINAILLSNFYRSNINLEHDLGNFIDLYYTRFLDYVDTNKQDLEKIISKSLSGEAFSYFENYIWLEELKKSDSLFMKFVEMMKNDFAAYKKAEESEADKDNYTQADYYNKLALNLKKTDVTEAFAKYNVIPAYGFPIDVVELKVNHLKSGRDKKEITLTRNLSIAISEYAPGSEVVVDKRKYTSRYISLPYESELPKYYYYVCQNESCGRVHVRTIKVDELLCETCNAQTKEDTFIVPEFGFIADTSSVEYNTLKPKKTYTSEISYLGSIEPFTDDLNINDFIMVQRTLDDSLLILNESPFFMCKDCGYTELSKDKRDLTQYIKEHKALGGRICQHRTLKQINLGYIVITDAIKMKINMAMSYQIAISTMTAILNGITEYLQIDMQDINGLIVKDNENGYAFVFYDTTYGGAGNVKQLLNKENLKSMVATALKSVDHDCCAEEVSCTNCLRNYRNNRHHKELIRGLARDTLQKILSEM